MATHADHPFPDDTAVHFTPENITRPAITGRPELVCNLPRATIFDETTFRTPTTAFLTAADFVARQARVADAQRLDLP